MRVLHFYKGALPEAVGGIEMAIDQIARSTESSGVENTVLALHSERKSKVTDKGTYQLVTVKRDFEFASNHVSWQAILTFKRLAARADLIHYHFPWPFADLVHFLVKPNIPALVTYHSDIVRQKYLLILYRPLMRRFLESVDHIVSTSPNYVHTSEVLQSFSKKTSIIPIGLDQASYPRPDPFQVMRYQQHFGGPFFLFIGAFRYYKGLEFLIQAAKFVSYPIVIAGSGSAEMQLKASAKNNKIDNLYFIGQVSEIEKISLLAASYCVILPSHLRSEAFGISLLEGAMLRKPLISCEIGTGTSYINLAPLTGLTVAASDPHALSSAMEWLWNRPDVAHEMGENAYVRYTNLFTAAQMGQSYARLYRSLLLGQSAASSRLR